MGLRRGIRDIIIDAWSWLNYKPIMQRVTEHPGARGAFPELAASWLPPDDIRRLAAYKLLAAYDRGQVGELTAASGGDLGDCERRELGDPGLLVDTALAHVLGAEQTITVPGAEQADEDDAPPGAAEAAARQDALRTWAEDELLWGRVQYAERRALLLGDFVYRLAWDPEKRRPTVRATDPGFYFPVIGDDDDEYPTRVHFAWELPADPPRGIKPRLRRITYELGPIGAGTVPARDPRTGAPVRSLSVDADGTPILTRGDRYEDGGGVSRAYPWSPDARSTVTCYLTDAEWAMEDLRGHHDVDHLPMDKATFRTRSDGETLDHLDLMIDFLPVVHVPNTVTGEEHWGQSILAGPVQLLDEIAATDTDSSRASATAGLPVIAVSGVELTRDQRGQGAPLRIEPGTVWTLRDGGSMDALDTSHALAELRSRTDHLLDRLSVVSRIPAVAMGSVDPTKVPSGYALALTLGPLEALVGSLRLAREHKYRLLLRFVQRLFQAGQHPDWRGPVLPAVVTFGPHTPTDRVQVLDDVIRGVTNGVLSLETGLRMLRDAGYPIEDVSQEIELIQGRAFDAAARLADATGDNGAVREYLGMPSADREIPAVPPIRVEPPAPGI